MIKKVWAIIISIIMTVVLASCIQVPQNSQSGDNAIAEPPAAEENVSETPENDSAPADSLTIQEEPKSSSQSAQTEISEEKAKEIALADAGIKSSDAVFKYTEFDYEDGFAVFEVEFFANDMEYSYEIDSASGTIISKEIEMMDAEDYMEMNAIKQKV